ncbi:hypothetical protein J2Q11_06120 [Tenacibaculum finnmarkense genomovar finnmarkense]|uniref:KAP family P-loop NTPase fold protein n=1 Tax=Tenacibaculum finnmarkense TaxID=2781243 RepID=UPI001E461529|nr:P-loop NTPase fold protein [Tenacibaculum finnmarkense]MCD8417186.1 KAP family NTPase [Tenacibaculum finnmarkense genomovar finnmarkense]MCG8185569.1 hypothetical protein [Tenacibaculum finnmarkense genomovar finnmarkense]MCG8202117.1 hypothetical protein [Tenacibaculum finnmarkense genomovar finnmarkense]MCG8209595.1 hypothetical protein [Tenacibaculum finnmarkense genomovar finnmarkense]MCG8212393.1 hypothetical protein [Tenacibaculum finnmarkense genomovar finnmarkense]
MSKLLSNLPIENLTPENDYIGIIEKGTLLKSFFLNNKDEFSQIKIFSIYGEWGSGKSTLMKYLEKELKGSFNTFFFESWEFESDANLANSLLEFLAKKSNTKADTFLANGSKLLEGFAKSVTFKAPFANFSAKEMLNHVDKQTFFELKEQFSKDFIDWENKNTTKGKAPKYNIVFIDDLDRCEPENVLNLLSAMKLFFTYGKKTIFLCGIDKKAVTEAVQTKYRDIVKANEYLEKVFDISFSMPEDIDAIKLVNSYFDENEKVNDKKLGDLINDFFEKLHFKNPRKIKKILNKYLIIKNLKESDVSQSLKLPNIIHNDSGTLFETYLTLYLLILNEFENDIFESFLNVPFLRIKTEEAIKKYTEDKNKQQYFDLDENLINKKLNDFNFRENQRRDYYSGLIAFFIPINVNTISDGVVSNIDYFNQDLNVYEKKYDYFFLKFLIINENEIIKDLKKSSYSLLNYKKIIANLI